MTDDALQLVCIACGSGFTGPRRRQGRYPRLCSPACRRARRLTQLERYRDEGRYAPRTKPAKRRSITKTCEVCRKPFETSNSATICCGITCGQVLASRRRSATRTAKSIAARQRVCEHCGGDFVARHPSGAAIAGKVREGRFCSRRCAADAMRVPGTTQLSLGLPS